MANFLNISGNGATDGGLPIASNAGNPQWGTLSGGTGITITNGHNTISLAASGATPLSFPTDSGTAIPAANALTIHGTHNINTSGSGSTVTVQDNNTATFGDLSVVTAGNPSLTLTSGDLTISGTGASAGGNINLPATDSSGNVGVININSARFIHQYNANGNTFVGSGSGNFSLSSTNTTAIGAAAGSALTSGTSNTLIGHASGVNLTSGVSNTLVGSGVLNQTSSTTASGNTIMGLNISGQAGFNGSNNLFLNATGVGQLLYNTTESSNILINSQGVQGESNVCRIGANGTGTAQQNITYLNGGNVSKPNSCMFLASQTGNQTNVTGDGTTYTPTFTNVIFDANSNFDGTSTFTAPVTGKYLFGYSYSIGSASSFAGMTNSVIGIITTAATYRLHQYNFPTLLTLGGGGQVIIGGSTMADMTASDTATCTFRVIGGLKDVILNGSTAAGYRVPVFWGYLVG